MKTHLLFTKNFIKASKEIKALGGHITQKFTKNVFVANLPDKLKATALVNSTTKAPAKLDAISTLMVKAWKTRKSGSGKPASKSARGGQPAQAALQLGGMLNDPPVGVLTPTSEKMTGSIALGVIIVSGNDSGTKINTVENKLIINAVMNSCQFLATAGGTFANITFHYDMRLIYINDAPNPSCSTVEKCEAVFRDPALKQLGFQGGDQGCVDYVEALRTKLQTDWAYMVFATKYPVKNTAYASGVRVCLHYPEMLDIPGIPSSHIFTRLSCKVFGAADETGACTCNGAGVYGIANYNCANCNETQKFPCIMTDLNALTLCPWTMSQLGWINPRTDFSCNCDIQQFANTFQVAYRDWGQQVSLVSWLVNGDPWYYGNLNVILPLLPKALGDPILSPYGNNSKLSSLMVIYRDTNNQLSAPIFSSSTGEWYYTNLSASLPNAAAPVGNPSVLRNQRNLVYKDANAHISHMYYNGGTLNWYYEDLNAAVPQAALPLRDPVITQFGKVLQVIYLDVNNHISQLVKNGNQWVYTDLNKALPQASDAILSPSVTQYGNTLVIIYQDTNKHLAQMTWAGQWAYTDLNALLPQAAILGGLRISTTQYNVDNSLHIVYRDVDNNISHIYYGSGNWNYDKIFINPQSGPPPIGEPSIATFNNELQVLYSFAFSGFSLYYWNGSGSWNLKNYEFA